MSIRKVFNGLSTVFYRIRLALLGAEIGEGCRFVGRIYFKIMTNSILSIGCHTRIVGGGNFNTLAGNRYACIEVDENAQLHIGKHCAFSQISIWSRSSITIGDYVMIGANSIINDSNSHSLYFSDRRLEIQEGLQKNIYCKPIIIEDDVFIGANSIILKGVRIGAKSIIAAGSVVTHDIPSSEIWGGNPAKFLKHI